MALRESNFGWEYPPGVTSLPGDRDITISYDCDVKIYSSSDTVESILLDIARLHIPNSSISYNVIDNLIYEGVDDEYFNWSLIITITNDIDVEYGCEDFEILEFIEENVDRNLKTVKNIHDYEIIKDSINYN